MIDNTGRLVAKVKHVDETDGVAYLELPNGTVSRCTFSDGDELAVGNVVLVGPMWDDVDKAPDQLWSPQEPWIGIVRLVLADEVVVVVGDRLRVFPKPAEIDVHDQYTVEGSDEHGIRRVLATHPIRQVEVGFGDPFNIEGFKFEPTESPSFEDFGGYEDIVTRVREVVEIPLQCRDQLAVIGARAIKGVLFTGDSGTGKTMLARVIANHAKATFYKISGPEVISKWMGESEEIIRKVFDDAQKQDRAIVFFDEIDSVAPQRSDESHDMSRRIVAQLLTLMDGFSRDTSNVVVIATTNRIQDVDIALRRPGRFDWEIEFPLPSRPDREAILAVSAQSLTTGEPLLHNLIADMTEGWSGAELTAIWSEAALLAVQDGRAEILSEDYFGGYERVAGQRRQATVEASPKIRSTQP